ncbi:MAG: MBL fold metallo-hydrolase, partial [Thermoanaerobaculia bacterium]
MKSVGELYFRQLLAGRDFAADDDVARQMVNFCYLIGDREKRECVVVDPAWDVGGLVDAAAGDGMRVVGALATHYHPDHVGGAMFGLEVEGAARLQESAPVPVHCHRDEAYGIKFMTGLSDSDLVLHDGGDALEVGDVRIELLHTPG